MFGIVPGSIEDSPLSLSALPQPLRFLQTLPLISGFFLYVLCESFSGCSLTSSMQLSWLTFVCLVPPASLIKMSASLAAGVHIEFL